MTVTHTSFRARRRRLAAALAIGFLVAGTGTTALADETPSPEPSASAEASPEAGAGQQAGQAPAGQGQAGQADQQAAPGAAAQEANGFKADNPGWANATKHTGEAHGVDENYTAKWTRADANADPACLQSQCAVGHQLDARAVHDAGDLQRLPGHERRRVGMGHLDADR